MNGLFFIEILSFISTLFISYADYRDRLIPIVYIFAFGMLSLLRGMIFLNEGWLMAQVPSLLIIMILVGGIRLYEFYRTKDLLGAGDKMLLIICGLWIPLHSVSWFFVLAGSYGVLTGIIYKRHHADSEKHIPFAPAILASLWTLVITE